MVEFFLGLFVGISICLSLCFGYGIYVLREKEEKANNFLDIVAKQIKEVEESADKTNYKRYES